MIDRYLELESTIVTDRDDNIIAIKPNIKGNYSNYSDSLPNKFSDLLIKKEDRFFFIHPGVNPVSITRSFISYFKNGKILGSSTITQQLAKNLLNNEQDRTIENKLTESLYSIALEIFNTKKSILKMYANTIYMGNQIQGLETASNAYFGKKLSEINDTEILSLLGTISSPSSANPWKPENKSAMSILSKRLDVAIDPSSLVVLKKFKAISSANFELNDLNPCKKSCKTTIDKNITDNLRDILSKNLIETAKYGGRNGAIVVIKLPENELLSVVGTSNTNSSINGSSINMALKPRPIGSTIKPFIYLKAFELGLRPYTLVDDKEYKYSIGTGFPLYPKNYDGSYRGIITIHEALSNSLNTPSVKTLEYISLNRFNNFLEQEMNFIPINPLLSYEYGIALGGLEMDPLTLSHMFTIFGNKGELKPLKLFFDSQEYVKTPQEKATSKTRSVADEKYVQLVNSIIADRISGVDQFGLASSLNLTQKNYAVKTGTSRDYHDTWTIGFTPDFLVAVWLGNVENEPMKQITSSTGAGKIWNESMSLLLNSKYNKKTSLDFSMLKAFEINDKLEYGLPQDNVESVQNLLLDNSLVSNPHNGDNFLLEDNTQIKLKSNYNVDWYIDDKFIGKGKEASFHPTKSKTYRLRAELDQRKDEIFFNVNSN
jgi:membrane carboxypeptidase/penicillin-binding protein PbpC